MSSTFNPPKYFYMIEGRAISKEEAIEIRDTWRLTSSLRKGEPERRYHYWNYANGKTTNYLRSRIAWASEHGQIPPFHVIHHKDFNTTNDVIANLECLHSRDHLRLHHIVNTRARIESGNAHLNVFRYIMFYDFIDEHGLDYVGGGIQQIQTLITAQPKHETFEAWVE